jgi:hypothetical protein
MCSWWRGAQKQKSMGFGKLNAQIGLAYPHCPIVVSIFLVLIFKNQVEIAEWV